MEIDVKKNLPPQAIAAISRAERDRAIIAAYKTARLTEGVSHTAACTAIGITLGLSTQWVIAIVNKHIKKQ